MKPRLLLGLVGGALLILGALYVVLVPDIGPARRPDIEARFETLRAACQLFEANFQRMPRDSNELVQVELIQKSTLLDTWDRPYRFQESGRTWRIVSLGPDGKLGSPDDKEMTFEFSVAPTGGSKAQAADAEAEAEIRAFVDRWLRAQNTGDFATYQQLYNDRMNGHKRAGARSYRFDRTGWLKDRKQLFAHPQQVEAENLRIAAHETGATVTLTQHFKSAGFEDRGDKRLTLVRRSSGLRIAQEEMLESKVASDQAASREQGFYFVVHADRPYAILRQGVDRKWAVEESSGHYTRVASEPDAWPVFVTTYEVSPTLPFSKQTFVGKTLQVWNAQGVVCTQPIEQLVVLAALTPAYELEMAWSGTDPDNPGPAWPEAKVANNIGSWAADNAGLALATPLTRCDGAFALDHGRQVQVLGGLTSAADELDRRAVELSHTTKPYVDSQQEYEQQGVNPEHPVWSTHESVYTLPHKSSLVLVSAFSSDYALGLGGGMLTLLVAGPSGSLDIKAASSRTLPSGLTPRLMIDLDADGTLELLTGENDFEMRHLVRFSPHAESVEHVRYADLACKS